MKSARVFSEVPRLRYRPEVPTCLHCDGPLTYSHSVWRKTIQSLSRVEDVTNLGLCRREPVCASGQTMYARHRRRRRSAAR